MAYHFWFISRSTFLVLFFLCCLQPNPCVSDFPFDEEIKWDGLVTLNSSESLDFSMDSVEDVNLFVFTDGPCNFTAVMVYGSTVSKDSTDILDSSCVDVISCNETWNTKGVIQKVTLRLTVKGYDDGNDQSSEDWSTESAKNGCNLAYEIAYTRSTTFNKSGAAILTLCSVFGLFAVTLFVFLVSKLLGRFRSRSGYRRAT